MTTIHCIATFTVKEVSQTRNNFDIGTRNIYERSIFIKTLSCFEIIAELWNSRLGKVRRPLLITIIEVGGAIIKISSDALVPDIDFETSV